MAKISQHISDFRKTTPRVVIWLLMAAIFVIVVVLLLLLVGSKRNKAIISESDIIPIAPELIFEPSTPIDWSNTIIGETRSAEIKVSANKRVQITDIVVQVEDEETQNIGLSTTTTCTNEQTFITVDTPCLITIDFEPMRAIPRTAVGINVKWTDFEIGPEPMETKNAVTAIIGAIEKPKTISKPVATPEPAPAQQEEYEEEDDGFYTDFGGDLDDIAPAVDFAKTTPAQVAPISDQKKYHSPFGNNCSDFSFPGYNTAGIQSGWITPEAGAYYYHPFSDTECRNATGIYNADTGYIMDITNPSRKIGSDAEHIRLTVAERMPTLGSRTKRKVAGRARQLNDTELDTIAQISQGGARHVIDKTKRNAKTYLGSGFDNGVFSSRPYDRSFVLRQYKPIPATIVSDIQAEKALLEGGLPVRATVDRNVYSDNGRTVIIPTGTLMLGYVTGDLPGPYKAVGKMQIDWYQFIRPDGVEFNFRGKKQRPFSADSQGRKGVPGHGSTDYLQQFVMPMLTAIVPAAVNLIAPISDAFVNQIDLDNNTVVQSGTVRSSELAKNEIITAWNNVATKLLVDMMDNTTPPFSIAAGTRITVFSPVDLYVTCGTDDGDVNTRKCAFQEYDDKGRADWRDDADKSIRENARTMEELIGQVRSLMQSSIQKDCCKCDEDGVCEPKTINPGEPSCSQYSFATIDFYCRSFGTYQAKNNAKQQALFENQKQQFQENTPQGTKAYNTQVLGLQYDENDNIKNPFQKEKKESAPAESIQTTEIITCGDGGNPDANGCCAGETYTDMGDQGFNCCPDAGGDCFPPIQM